MSAFSKDQRVLNANKLNFSFFFRSNLFDGLIAVWLDLTLYFKFTENCKDTLSTAIVTTSFLFYTQFRRERKKKQQPRLIKL